MKLRNIEIETVRLELTSNCQLKCEACPTANGLTARHLGKGYLSVDNFAKFLELNDTVRQIELSNWGEPFLNKDFLSILKIADNNSITLNIDNGANLNYVHENVLEGIVKYKLNRLTCSIDGASNEVYAKYRKGGNLSNVLKNIKKINKLKEYYNTSFPHLTWQFIVFGHNQHETDLAQQLAYELNMDFKLRLNWKIDYSPAHKTEKLPVVSREQYYNQNMRNYKRDICKQLWIKPQINWDGKILGCCNNYWKPFEGNAFEKDLLTLLNLPEIAYSRAMLLRNAPPKSTNPCVNCKKYLDLKRDNSWFTTNEIYPL